MGANYFLLEWPPLQKGTAVQKREQEVTHVVSLVKNGEKSATKCIQHP